MQNNKVSVLLFDVSPFLYMAYYGATSILNNQADLSDEDKICRVAGNILLGKIQSCFNLIPDNSYVLPIFCYDGINSTVKKKQVNQNYKAGRTHPLTKKIRTYLMNMFKLYPGYHLINDEEEADDLLSSMKDKVKSNLENCEFYIFSKDNDLLQLCDYRTCFFDPGSNGGFRDRKYLKEKFDLENFKHIILYKVCFGDKSDNIEGIFKRKRHKPIIAKFNDCLIFKDFINLDILETSEQKLQAKDLYSIIKLKSNLIYEGKLISDCSQLENTLFLYKASFIL